MNIKKISIPDFLKKDFYFSHFRVVNINKIYVGIINSKSRKIEYVNIKKTPHYNFVLNFIGVYRISKSGTTDYNRYIKSNLSEHRSEQKFINLIESMDNNGYQYDESPILVFKSLKRAFPLGRFDVADGFHRLAILAALNSTNIKVAILKRRQNVFLRIINKLV